MKIRTAILICLLALVSGVAGAQTTGLFAEQFTSVDGVSVRRIRDTGTGVICYVAVGHMATMHSTIYSFGGHSPAISCVRL